ncbi:hypothetical protein AWZ03_009681 [Drosophila navojoa]|uniref:Uncharacterized protein n=1 Tax=Drosophila navojoa TaxID=7232 RepID=A0A484B7T3_DRONA|nr:hypothetical protein AWZ03_009681 [Drosophila navojoa]
MHGSNVCAKKKQTKSFGFVLFVVASSLALTRNCAKFYAVTFAAPHSLPVSAAHKRRNKNQQQQRQVKARKSMEDLTPLTNLQQF